ncbi:hypothetical protein [Amycolatopsis echigonensis]|uniref:Uncharacterized protein n=1 Tax=Amycolatopsis echigonensis TaxID=2576905 RepID=A0A8E1T196_9PSEU|nr:hypothetical protein [Amycolatopsis echigonensis]MBB2497581.1 hypothetical protein [Amycolatopsis echigonensis]
MVWARTLLTTLVILAVAWFGVALTVFHRGGGTQLVWLSAALIVVLPAILGRSGIFVVLNLFVAGLHLVMIFMTGSSLIDGYVLETRGVPMRASATGYTDHWTAVQFTPPDKYTKNALVVVTPDGQHGLVAVEHDKPGSTVSVVVDPKKAVDLHRPDEVGFGVGVTFGIVDALMVLGWNFHAARSGAKSRRRSGEQEPAAA